MKSIYYYNLRMEIAPESGGVPEDCPGTKVQMVPEVLEIWRL